MKINNVLIITQSRQDKNYIEAITKLDNAGFAYSVIDLQLDGVAELKNKNQPFFLGKKEKLDEVRRILGRV